MQSKLAFESIPSLWTIIAAPARGRSSSANERLPHDLRRLSDLADAVTHAVDGFSFSGQELDSLFDEAAERLRGDRLRELSKSIPLSHRWFEKLYTSARDAYGLDQTFSHRPARALLLVAAEHRFVPVAEGAARAAAWWPSSARLDMRSAFHVVTQWGEECDPLFGRLTVAALAGSAAPLPWPPFKAFYEYLLAAHDPDDERRQTRATNLASATAKALTLRYREQEPTAM